MIIAFQANRGDDAMTKKTKKILKICAAVFALVFLVIAGLLVKMHLETGGMAPLATQEVMPGVYAVRDGYVNVFVLRGENGFIAVDAGDKPEAVSLEMKKLSIDPGKVSAVFLTHSDFDHVAALKLFANASVYLSRDEEQMINGKTPRFVVIHNRKIPAYSLLDDNQVIEAAGLKVTAIATPGHTPGAMCYVINDSLLFTGDTMSLKNGKVDVFNEFFNMDTQTERESIRKLASLRKLKYVFTAHHGFSDDPGKAFDAAK